DLNLTEKAEQYLEKEYANLEKTTNKPRIRDDTERYMEKDFKGRKRPHNYHIVEALFRYLEDMESIRRIESYIKEKKEGKVKLYTSEEVRKELKEYYDKKEKNINKETKKSLKGIGDREIAEKIENRVENHLASHPTQNGYELEHQ
ncbi:64_t:CDS:2, partial [Cetraspora pellucida]